MEALRTRVDNLQWEVQRLEVENRKLRERDPAAGERVDREAELESARANVEEMAERIKTMEQQLADSEAAVTEARHRTSQAVENVAELDQRIADLMARRDEERATARDEASAHQTTMSQLEEALQSSRSRARELETELAAAEEARQATVAGVAEIAADRDRVREQAELERYRALEEARRNWETREARLYARLECVEEELRCTKTATNKAEDEHLRGQLGTLASELRSVQSLVQRLGTGSRSDSRPETPLSQRQTLGGDIPSAVSKEPTCLPNQSGIPICSRESEASTSRTRCPQCPITTSGGYVTQVQGGEHGVSVPLWSQGGGERVGEGVRLEADFPGENQEQYGELGGDGAGGIRGDAGDQTHCPAGRNVLRQCPVDITPRSAYATALCGRSQRGSSTQTTASTDRPRTVTFSQTRNGPPSFPVMEQPATQTVSEKYCYNVHRDHQNLGSGPPQPQVRGQSDHRSLLPGGHFQGVNMACTENLSQLQARVQPDQANNHTALVNFTVPQSLNVPCGAYQPDPAVYTVGLAGTASQGTYSHCGNYQLLQSPLGTCHNPVAQSQPGALVAHQQVPGGLQNNGEGVAPSMERSPGGVGHVLGSYPAQKSVAYPQLSSTAAGVATVNSLNTRGVPQSPASAPTSAQPSTTSQGAVGPTGVPTTTTGSDVLSPPWTAALPLCSVPMMGQIPQIPRFTGEGRATGDSFVEWHEHFENVAKLAGWDDHWRLVHLTSNLRDTAMAFYRSCSAEVRNKYPLLVTALKRRFTPIRLTAVQAQLFHNRQQQEKETVDQFAQDLQKLYNLAYAGATSEGPQAERMGQTLLANQFITGLRSDLKQKLIGTE